MICFSFRDMFVIQFVLGQKAKATVIAEVPFEYVNDTKTTIEKEKKRNQLAPIYRLSLANYDKFEKQIFDLDDELDVFVREEKTGNAYLFELREFVRNFNEKNHLMLSWNDIDILIKSIDDGGRTSILLEALSIVREILCDGVYSDRDLLNKDESYLINIEISGQMKKAHIRSTEEALRYLRIQLESMDVPFELKQALLRIVKIGIAPNLSYDETATNAKIFKVMQEVKPVIDTVNVGDVIVEAGTVVKSDVRERLMAYRKVCNAENTMWFGINSAVMTKLFMIFCILIIGFLCLKMSPTKSVDLSKNFSLIVTILVVNLIIIRGIFQIGEIRFFMNSDIFVRLLPYVSPFYLNTILGTLLVRTYVGVVLGGLTSVLFSMMLAENLEFLLMCILTVFTSAYYCRRASLRSQVMYTGICAPTVFSFIPIFHFLLKDLESFFCIRQVFCSFVTGITTSIFVLGVLPLFEKWFGCCTNIRLVELNDHSNSLMQKLQMLAPGTYHHSLIVANIAEQAAMAMNANAFLCRTFAMYHDIGKVIKPGYFTENQRADYNPHDEKTPFISAIIIKTHVRDGIVMAEQADIPPRVIDGIREHHGTSIIRYFYNKALQQNDCKSNSGSANESRTTFSAETIDEAVFRYDGPKPRSKETAILMVADSLEAASRSMKVVNPQSIKDLVDNIIEEKVNSNQLDDCSMTLKEINELRKALYSIMINMLHSRIAYDNVSKK
ncbi:MAG: HDIG domain-containing protein [Puniceicoccales bacterium]|nr:HDIG domain-containing protein [Puniceicoccales bacterium]